ncbi:GDSL esterase/lipase APG-like [Lycium ferocissimum]|uniref:GDSL esterase/lipase APG-like n=1 Tax=Lycium ferocissimum TaxID=112874 RepID=UPI002815185D|nr:GDSL esterase/lipase APG-like [Lycium ferocissimum]
MAIAQPSSPFLNAQLFILGRFCVLTYTWLTIKVLLRKLSQHSLWKMSIHSSRQQILALFLVALLCFATRLDAQDSTTLVPAIITFGDSAVDVGNNDYIHTLFKANYPPYGRDFVNNQPTGRFCNGKLATDITADTLGFTTYPAAYLSPQASGKNLLIGANFASAAAGFDDKTAILNHAIALSTQMQYYKEYQSKLATVAGSQKAASIIKDALYIISAGNSDFLQNYYINPYINKVYTPDQYGSYLVGIFNSFVKDLYGQGARRIGVTSLPPLGCLPAARTLFGFHQSGCVSNINTDAQNFNKKMNSAATQLGKQLPGLKIAIFDIYQPLYDLIKSPSDHGFSEANRGCCGTGTVETTSLLCNPKSPGTCSNATQYVFWDSVHPSQAANQVLADSLIIQGINLIS